MGRKRLVAASLFGATAVAGFAMAGSASAAPTDDGCGTTSYEAGLYFYMYRGVQWDTGITIPPAGPGQQLVITSATWMAFDIRPEDESPPTRAEENEAHESFTVTVGGVQLGPLTPDLPDTVAEGAMTDNHSGIQTGSFPGGPTNGGDVVALHSSAFGFDEADNGFNIKRINITVECRVVPTTTAAPTTTAPATTAPAPTTTQAGSGGTTPTTAAPTTAAAASGALPVTGSPVGPLVAIAAVLLGVGGVMVARTRRSAS
jgi:hypothetical protein